VISSLQNKIEIKSIDPHCQLLELKEQNKFLAYMQTTTKSDLGSMHFEMYNHKGRSMDNLDVKKEGRELSFEHTIKKGKAGTYKFCVNSVNFKKKIVHFAIVLLQPEDIFDKEYDNGVSNNEDFK